MQRQSVQQSLHTFVTQAGFELLERVQIYRATVQTDVGDGIRNNVFLELNGEKPTVMSPIGPESDISPQELEVARLADDGYGVTVVAGSAAFTRDLHPDALLADPNQILLHANEIGSYAAAVWFVIQQNKMEREELIGILRPIVDTQWDDVTSGQIPVESVLKVAERLFTISPDRGVWAHVVVTARKAARHAWATGSGNLGDQPWMKIAERLEAFGNQRGLELKDEDWD